VTSDSSLPAIVSLDPPTWGTSTHRWPTGEAVHSFTSAVEIEALAVNHGESGHALEVSLDVWDEVTEDGEVQRDKPTVWITNKQTHDTPLGLTIEQAPKLRDALNEVIEAERADDPEYIDGGGLGGAVFRAAHTYPRNRLLIRFLDREQTLETLPDNVIGEVRDFVVNVAYDADCDDIARILNNADPMSWPETRPSWIHVGDKRTEPRSARLARLDAEHLGAEQGETEDARV
jgi:hypothetical protein